jgi:TolB-like protein
MWAARALILACIFAGWLAPLRAESRVEKRPIAVLDLEVTGGTREQALALSNQLRTEILKTGQFTVVDRSQINAILEEQALQQTGCTTQECAVRVGRILGVRQIVTGTVTKIDNDLWQVSVLLIDAESAETLRGETLNHAGTYRELLVTGMRWVAERLALSGPAPPAPQVTAARGPAEPVAGHDAPTSWRVKWIAGLAGGLVAADYGYTEAQATADSNDKQKSILAQMKAASSAAQYDSLASRLRAEESSAKSHQQDSDLGYATAAVFLGLAAWIYLDRPESPERKTAWVPSAVPHGGGMSIALFTRW